MSKQPDLFGARNARDEALEQVAENSGHFMRDAYLAILRLPSGRYTGEDVRLNLEAKDIIPHHHNAWGALCAKCVKDGILRPTGSYTAMKTRKSHARRTPVYYR